jgi:anaerobic magnesium-protoporphyrin IX monomethyl ester cyclase
MARILLIDFCENDRSAVRPLEGYLYVNLGLSSIWAFLKSRGHEVQGLVLSARFPEENRAILAKWLAKIQPSIVGLSTVSATFPYAERCSREIRQLAPSAKIVLGGTHATLNPEEATAGAFDVICIGEGEYPLAELADAISKETKIPPIANLWIRRDNGLWDKTPPRDFMQDLDVLPMANLDAWQEFMVENWLDVQDQYVVLLGRGCPFLCSFCCNHVLRKVTSGKYVRFRSPNNILAEVASIKNRYPDIERLYFEVETIGADEQWLANLCSLLREFNNSVKRPLLYRANMRIQPGQNWDKIFSLMREANFDRLNMGVESGSERIRKEVMHRHYLNQDVIKAAAAARRHGLRIRFNNIVGLPGETYADHLDTVRLNQMCRPDEYNCVIFEPYFGTELYKVCKNMGILDVPLPEGSSRLRARFGFPSFSRRQIQFARDVFGLKMAMTHHGACVGWLVNNVLDRMCMPFWDYWTVRRIYQKILRILK